MPVEAKLFFEVFPELNMDKELSSLFEDTMIEKVVMKQAERQLIISLLSKHLISRRRLYRWKISFADIYFVDVVIRSSLMTVMSCLPSTIPEP